MIFSNIFSIQLLSLALLFSTCQSLTKTSPIPEEDTDLKETEEVTEDLALQSGKPYFGFNAKANLQMQVQIAYADALFDEIPSEAKENLTIRIPGGTLSQKVYSQDFSDDELKSWATLQEKHGFRMVFVVNGNDSPNNQKMFIQRWMDAGVRFDFLEMMNEYYLSKFAKGSTEKAEVSQKVTPQLYVNEILPMFFNELDGLGLPYFVICAPAKKGKSGERLDAWNDVIVAALNDQFKNREMGIVLHLYKRSDASAYDYAQINRLRGRISYQPKVAITEMGILDDNASWSEIAEPTKQHYTRIFSQLGSGDYLFDQVLFNTYGKDNIATLHPKTNGLTPKGEKVVELIKAVYE